MPADEQGTRTRLYILPIFHVIASSRPINLTDIAGHYDELDPFYRELWGKHVHHGLWKALDETSEKAAVNLVELVAEQGGIGTGDRVLDIGCGYGAPARLLAKKFGSCVTAITVSRATAISPC